MKRSRVRILLLADTHLGFDFPFKPRIKRRRRGPDFFANFEHALAPALEGEVDLVVHGGDLFHRSIIPDALVEMAMKPLLRVAERGIPVYLVPGNHERSKIPLQIWTVHPNLHIFRQPETFICQLPQASIALSGFPFNRHVRDSFTRLLSATGYRDVEADIHLLCIHQAVEGATVGPRDFTFRKGADVIPGREIPADFDAVMSGHIHRSQVLDRDLAGNPLPAPVFYPGSIERTAFAEIYEDKHFLILTIDTSPEHRCPQLRSDFVPLPTRPMAVIDLTTRSGDIDTLIQRIRHRLETLDPSSVVRFRLGGLAASQANITAALLREIAPLSMNVSLRFTDDLMPARDPDIQRTNQ